jgi:hypothetical protein
VCGAADRIIGWGAFGRTKPIIASALALGGIAYGLHLPPVACVTFPIAFLVWRTPGWNVLGGSINPAPHQAFGTFLRHALSLGFIFPAYWAHLSVLVTGSCMLCFAALATALAVWNYENKAHANQTIETLRGLGLGVFLALAFVR